MGRLTPGGWRFPPAETAVLDNGMRVKLVDMPGRLVATVAVTLALPTRVEPPGREGSVAAYAAMLTADPGGAAASRVGPAARIGAALTSGCDHRGPKVVADCPVTDLPELLAELATTLLGADPTEGAFELCRRRRLAELDHQLHDPYALANKLFNESVLDPSSRYARPVTGTRESWRRLHLDDVLELRERHVDPRHMTIVVVGDLGLLDVPAAVQEAFGGHPSAGVPAVADRAPRPGGPPQVTLRPGRAGAQTQLMLGCFAIDRSDPRWPSARVGAELLGGGAASMLNVELRHNLAASYGVEARFLPYFAGGLFVVSGSVDDARSEAAVDAIVRTLRAVVDEGVDPDVFEQVRDRMATSAPQLYESTLAVAQQYAELISCDLPESFIDAHLEQLRALRVDRLDADLRSLLDPDRMHAVVVGRFDVEASLLAGLPRQGDHRAAAG